LAGSRWESAQASQDKCFAINSEQRELNEQMKKIQDKEKE
jgi:hypothetical protein